MRIYFILFIFLTNVVRLQAQQFSYQMGEILARHAMTFLGKPYLAGTLESSDGETPILPSHGFDCYTLVERSLALAIDSTHLQSNTLHLRYRNARVDGYCSRIHYLSEWIHVHRSSGVLEDVTPGLPGVQNIRFNVNYMSSHARLYPGMLRDSCRDEMIRIEKSISDFPFYFVPKEKLKKVLPFIKQGDIIAITTRKKGLDYSHLGIAVWKKGRLHLLHASATYKQVVVSKQTLMEYLMKNAQQTGITVLRLRPL